ncbi:hypothetical protein ENUP19_0282G0020, partial [Entamoeba nuttalli]
MVEFLPVESIFLINNFSFPNLNVLLPCQRQDIQKSKTCDPFCPQSRKDAEVKSHQPEDLPYKEENDLKIPRKLKTMQYLLEHNGKPNIQSSEKRRKELAKITGQVKKTEAKKI